MRADLAAETDGAFEFWIDVGGTFTDCLCRDPGGAIRTHKLLSSGAYRGRVGPGSTAAAIVDPGRASDPEGFFTGFQLRLLAPAGESDERGEERIIVRFDPATRTLVLDRPLARAPHVGIGYELIALDSSTPLPAPVVGIRWLLGRWLADPVGPVAVRLGTTRGTNALLERQGARTALVTTRGFGDVLRIAQQNRPKLFDLEIRRPSELYEAVVELDERLDANGNVLRALDEARVRACLEPLLARGIESLAVCLLHGYRSDIHEELVERVARELGFGQISLSARVAPLLRIVPRGDTTVVDAYLTPIIRSYVAEIRSHLPEARIKLMTSAGGLVEADRFVGKDSVLSGPAGGVVGMAHIARAARFSKAIGFDMGGTSTDVSRYDGTFERRYLMEVNDPGSDTGVRIVAPMLAIETVAAGGGSVAWFDGQKPRVGPRSAGSDPGPACYGRGGPLTVTDVNLLLGRILPEEFAFPLDRRAAAGRLEELLQEIRQGTGQALTREELAYGLVRIANATMAAAIKTISLAKGHDVRDYVLVTFGGAGAQHACALAAELGIRKVLLHPYAGILSAFGIGMADVQRFGERHVGQILSDEVLASLEPAVRAMELTLAAQVRDEGIPSERIAAGVLSLDLRYLGQDATINIARPADGDFRAEFERRHRRLYGFHFPERRVEILSLRLEVTGHTEKPRFPEQERTATMPVPSKMTRTFLAGAWRQTAVYQRDRLVPGARLDGPAIILEPISTILVEPGWRAEMTETSDLILTHVGSDDPDAMQAAERATAGVDPIQLELMSRQFTAIAEQMGVTLRRTSVSTNVKERLDFSCALFTAAGELVVNAPHIPVHLGAMGETVKRLQRDIPAMRPGDVYITNDPFRGGSHLPDVTVVTPVFDEAGRELLFFTGSRAHHAEIGGIVPGSMPPFSKSLAEEGVLIRAFRLVSGERSSERALRDLLASGPYPSRALEENIADINAQVAANATGARLLVELVQRHGLAEVVGYMGHIQRAAESKMRAALARLPAGEHRFTDSLDNGSVIAVTITIRHEPDRKGGQGGSAIVDFAGTGPVSPDNQNANPAIVRSAVLYCFRCLIDEDIPLNDGVLAPVTIRIPENCLINPHVDDDPARCPAVGGGNVETSQRIVDVLFGALGVVAASQGTMNNFLFGRAASGSVGGFGYYETIGGGAGAGPGFAGASAVHTHMTNTRITDAEVLETRYPARVEEFSIRRDSGGAGRFRGGDGLCRQIRFLAPVEISLITNRRLTRPYGLAGGAPGTPGRNQLLPRDGSPPVDLGYAAQRRLEAGDAIRIETPGGGGYGPAS